MITPGDRVLVAVSGGADSVALLSGLHLLQKRLNIHLGIAHIHHGLRPGSAQRDLDFVRSVARELSLPFYFSCEDTKEHSRKTGSSVEVAGRQLRYQFLDKTARTYGYTKIATGHHSDDNAEQVLLAMLRGAGPEGIAGIPPVRGNTVIRPMIRLKRDEIRIFLSDINQPFCEDETNSHTNYDRNRIRHILMPILKEQFNPDVAGALNRLSESLRIENMFMASQMPEVATPVTTQITLSIATLHSLPEALQRRWARRHLQQVSPNTRFTLAHTTAVINLAAGPAGKEVHLPGNTRCQKKNADVLSIIKEDQNLRTQPTLKKKPAWKIQVMSKNNLPCSVYIPDQQGEIKFSAPSPVQTMPEEWPPHIMYFDFEKIEFPVAIRPYEQGDRFSPTGMLGRQKISRYFKNTKVSLKKRASIPLIISGDTIIGICGYRTSEEAKITAETRWILKVEVLLA